MTTIEERRLQFALDYAIAIIESYESDMRVTKVNGTSLADLGICQGTIYRGALTHIKHIKEGVYDVDE